MPTSLLSPSDNAIPTAGLWDELLSPTATSQTQRVPSRRVFRAPEASVPLAPPNCPTEPTCCKFDFTDSVIPGALAIRETSQRVRQLGEQAKALFPLSMDDPKVTVLRSFFAAIFKPEDRICFFALMRPDIRKLHIHQRNCPNGFPDCIFKKKTKDWIGLEDRVNDSSLNEKLYTSGVEQPCWPQAALSPISTSLNSTRFNHAVAKLDLLNRLGYEIYFCPNPIAFGKRSKRTVRTIRLIVLEFDQQSLQEQLRLLQQIQGVVVAAVFSGGKSLHLLVALNSPIWNTYCPNSFRDLWSLQRYGMLDERFNLPEFDRVVRYWKYELNHLGLSPDETVLRNFSTLTRVPGFLHPLHNRRAELLYLNPSASWNRSNIGLPEDWEVFLGRPCPFEVPSAFGMTESQSSGFLRNISGIMTSTDVITAGAAEVPRGSLDPVCVPVTTMVQPLNPGMPLVGLPTTKDGQATPVVSIDPVSTMVQPDARCRNGVLDRTFLEDLTLFCELKQTGIPGRHQRRGLHLVLFTAARNFGWFGSEERIGMEWRAILSIHPGNIGCTVEQGVNDILGEWRAIREDPFRIWLPDCARLPHLSQKQKGNIERRVAQIGCPKPLCAGVAGIMINVLWPVIKKACVPCQEGRVAIQSRQLQRFGGRNAKSAREWLRQVNLLRMTDVRYEPGKRSRLYFVNAALVIWLAGIQEELVWRRTT